MHPRDRKLQTAALLFLASLIAWIGLTEAAVLPRSAASEKLEVHCIEEYGKYCGGKLSGFRFSDGCRVCKCEKTAVLCKKGPCKFFAGLDEDALDYCDGVLLRNAVAYKEFTRKAKAEKQKQQTIQGPKIDARSLKFNIKYETRPKTKKEEQAIKHEMIGVLQDQMKGAIQQTMQAAVKKQLTEKQPPNAVAVAPRSPTDEGAPVDANDFRRMLGRPSRLPSVGAADVKPPNLGSSGLGADVIRPPGSTGAGVGLQKPLPVQRQQLQTQLERKLTAQGLGGESIHPLEGGLPRQAPVHVPTVPQPVDNLSSARETLKGHAIPSAPRVILERDLLPQAAPPQIGLQGLAPGAVVQLPSPDQRPVQVPPPPPPPPPPRPLLPQRPPVPEGPKIQQQQPVLHLNPQVPTKADLPPLGKADVNLAAAPLPPPPARGPALMPLPKDRVQAPRVASGAGKMQSLEKNIDLAALIDKLSLKNNPPKHEVPKKPVLGPQLSPRAPASLLGGEKLPALLKPDTVFEEYFLPRPAFEDWPPLPQPVLPRHFVEKQEAPMLKEGDVVRETVAQAQPMGLDRPHWQPFNEYVQEPTADIVPTFHAIPDSAPCDGPRHWPIPESELSAAYEKAPPVGFHPSERHRESWPEWQAPHHSEHPLLHRPASEPAAILGDTDLFSFQQKQSGHPSSDSSGKMSDKVKNLLELTKAAIELLLKANYTEAGLLQNVTGSLNATKNGTAAGNKMYSNSSDAGLMVGASDKRKALRKQVKQLTEIINQLQEIVPQVEEYAREEEKEEKVKAKEESTGGEVSKLISASSIQAETSPDGVVLLSPLGALAGTDHGESDHERLLMKLQHCEAYSAKLLKALEEKKMLDSLGGVSNSGSSSSSPKDYLLSLLTAMKPLL